MQHSLTPSGDSSQLLCTDNKVGYKNKMKNRQGQYLVGVCPTSWKFPVLQAPALLFFGGGEEVKGWLVLSEGAAVWESSLLQSH